MKRWVCLAGILFSLVLMLLPGGVSMTFAPDRERPSSAFIPFSA